MIYNVWDKLWREKFKPDFHPELVKIVCKFSPGNKILEIGYGSGGDLSFLSKKGYKCFGLESSKIAFKESREKRFLFRSYFGEGENCPFRGKSFDLIFHQGVMEHFKDPRRFLSEHWRLLKNNGVIVIDVPHKWNLYTPYRLIQSMFGNWYGGWERSYSSCELERLIKPLGFEIIDIYYRGIWPHVWGKFLFPDRIVNRKLIQTLLGKAPLIWFQKISRYLYENIRFIKILSSYNVILVARKRPIRVLIDPKATNIHGGGIKRYVSKIIKLVDKSDYQIMVDTKNSTGPDIFHATANWGFSTIPTVLTLHDIIPARFPDYFKESSFPIFSKIIYFLRVQFSIWLSSRVICTSEISARDISDNFIVSKRKTLIIPMAVDEIFFKPKKFGDKKVLKRLGITKKYILFHGGIDQRKNIESLIMASADFSLELVISGYNATLQVKLEKVVKSLRMGNRVKFCGWVSNHDIATLVRNASLVAYPTKAEGFGMPLLESMAAGVPVVASNLQILRKLGKNVPIYVNPNSVSDIKQGMKSALNGISNKRMSEGREIAKLYTWSNTVRSTCKAYFDTLYRL